MAAAPPAQPSVDSPESATREVYYRLSGTGLRTATVREPATFSIEACDDKGARVEAAGDGSFFVSVRGVAPVRARIMDHADGRYTVSWQPPQSGKYSFNVRIGAAASTRQPPQSQRGAAGGGKLKHAQGASSTHRAAEKHPSSSRRSKPASSAASTPVRAFPHSP